MTGSEADIISINEIASEESYVTLSTEVEDVRLYQDREVTKQS